MDILTRLTGSVADTAAKVLNNQARNDREAEDPLRAFNLGDIDSNFHQLVEGAGGAPYRNGEVALIAMVLAGERGNRINKDNDLLGTRECARFMESLQRFMIVGVEEGAFAGVGGAASADAAAGGGAAAVAPGDQQQQQRPSDITVIDPHFDTNKPVAIGMRWFAIAIRAYGEYAKRAISRRPAEARLHIHHLNTCIERWRPGPGHLTPAHGVLCDVCLVSHNAFFAATARLADPIFDINPNLSGSGITDYLDYYYFGGLCYASLQQWNESLDMLEQVLIAPARGLSVRTIAACKAYLLVSFISSGEGGLPSGVRQARALSDVCREYQNFIDVLNKAVTNRNFDAETRYESPATAGPDGFRGLCDQATHAVPSHRARAVTQTFITVSLNHIAQSCGANEQFALHRLRGMVQRKELACTYDATRKIVSFKDEDADAAGGAASSSTEATAEALRQVMEVNRVLAERQELALLHPGHCLAMTENLPQAIELAKQELQNRRGGGGVMAGMMNMIGGGARP